MAPEEYSQFIPQYLAGQLSELEREAFERELAASASLRREVEELRPVWDGLGRLLEQQPSAAMRARFYQSLNAMNRPERNAAAEPKRLAWNLGPLFQLALGVLIFAGGVYVGRAKFEEPANAHAQQIAQMSSQVQSLRETVALSLLERQSAASRLEGVSWSSQVDRPNQQLLSALLTALNRDANVNVRLSSLNALERFSQNAEIGQALIDSIQRQDSPLVQIALIDSLVQARNRAAEPEFKKLTASSLADPAVRQRAQWALQKLNNE